MANGVRERYAFAGVRGASPFPLHDGVREFVKILDVAGVAQAFHDLEDRFRGRLLAQFQHHQFRIENFGKKRGHEKDASD